MIYAQLVHLVVSVDQTLVIPQIEYVDFTIDHQHAQQGCPARSCNLWVFFVKLVIQLIKCFWHQHSQHLIQVSSFIQHRRPLSDLPDKILLHIEHALITTVPIQHGEKGNKFPLTSAHIFLHYITVLHELPPSKAFPCSSVEPVELKYEFSNFNLVMQIQLVVFLRLDPAEDPGFGDQLSLDYLGYVIIIVLIIEQSISEARVNAFGPPAHFLGEPTNLLIQVIHVDKPVLLLLIKPIFTILAHFAQLIHLLGRKWVLFIFFIVGPVQRSHICDFVV